MAPGKRDKETLRMFTLEFIEQCFCSSRSLSSIGNLHLSIAHSAFMLFIVSWLSVTSRFEVCFLSTESLRTTFVVLLPDSSLSTAIFVS